MSEQGRVKKTERPHAAEGPLGRPEPWTATALRVVVHAITATVIAWPLAADTGVLAAAIGAGLGSLVARYVARSTLRLPAVLGLGALGLGVVLLARWFAVDLAFVPQAFGPAGALLAGDAIVFGLGSFVVSTVLRTLSARWPAMTILEVVSIGAGFATLVVAHRHGAIHRPYALADPLISAGEDPAIAILAVGAAGALVIGLLLLAERSFMRSIFHIAVMAVLLVVIVWTTVMSEDVLPSPASGGGGLQLQDTEQQSQSGRRSSEDLPFVDEYPDPVPIPEAVVIFHDDYSPPSGYYYFRQGAFSQYNGTRLVAATIHGVDEDVHNVFPTGRAFEARWAPGVTQDRRTLETTVGLMEDNSAPLALEAPERFLRASNPAPQRFRRVYRVQSISLSSDSWTLLDRPVADPSWSEEIREHYVRGPDDPRYRALADHIVQALPEDLGELPMARAMAIVQYLGQHGTYSLRSRHAGAEDPTAHFLFGDLTGYCVHFAHAAVFLMRSMGIPARVASGYGIAESSRQGGSALILRNSDQHAWPEVFVEDVGWVVLDVAPENVLSPPGGPPDPQLQQLLAEMLRGSHTLTDAPLAPLRDRLRVGSQWVGIVLGGLAIAVVLFGYFMTSFRLFGRGRSGAVYRAALQHLALGGIRRRWGESPERFARRLAEEDAIPSLRPLTAKHLASAFGGRPRPALLPKMRDDLRGLRAELRRAVPFWRRLLGALNPFSWLLTR